MNTSLDSTKSYTVVLESSVIIFSPSFPTAWYQSEDQALGICDILFCPVESFYIQQACSGTGCLGCFLAFIVFVIHVMLSSPQPWRETTFHSSVCAKNGNTIELELESDCL